MGTSTGSHLGLLAVVCTSGDGTFLSTLLQPGVMRRVNPVRIVWVLLYLEYSKVDACGGAGESRREGRTEKALAALIVDGGREIFLAP